MSPGVSGIVLAAGTSSRLAGDVPKQLLELDGRSLLRRVAEAAVGSRLAEVLVVLGHASERVAAALDGLPVTVVENPDYDLGQSTSVRAGLACVAPDAYAALFMPADQPLMSSRLIDRLLDVHSAHRGKIVIPTHDRRRGAPVLFDRAFFRQLAELEGDAGGRRLLPLFGSRIVEMEVDDPLELEDVDTAADLKRVEASLTGLRTGRGRLSPGRV